MTTTIEYALMAGASYISTRADINQFPVPDGWLEEIEKRARDDTTGFEATYFQNIANPNEIVISFAGTNFIDPTDWTQANMPLAFGIVSEQLRQAADYYMQIYRDNPGATITFTGHSLGGGLAALMGVFFGRQAVTFDQAPFANTAELGPFGYGPLDLMTYLMNESITDPAMDAARDDMVAMLNFYMELQAEPEHSGIPNADLVSTYRVEGEAVTSVWPASSFESIGTENPPIAHGDYSNPVDLHSQALLTAFLQSDATAVDGRALNDVTFTLTGLLAMIFDDKLFYRDPNNKDDPQRNFLEHLVRHEAGVQGSFAADGMVTRFTADLWKIAQEGGLTLTNNDISNTLIAFAMQMYYANAAATDSAKHLFTSITGGVQFDRSDVASTLTAAKGYTEYFIQYLAGLPSIERQIITQNLPNLLDWYIQAGSSGMNAIDTLNRGAFMLGGGGSDALVGGAATDMLAGNAGNDVFERMAA